MITPILKLPTKARELCWSYNGFVVGGAVDWLLSRKKYPPKSVRDIDVVIPIDEWQRANKSLIGLNCHLNALGGLCFNDYHPEELFHIYVDVWPEDVARVVSLFHKNNKILHVKSNTLLMVLKL